MFGKRNSAPIVEPSQDDFEDAGVPNLPLSPATVKHLDALRDRKILPTGRHENDASNWRTYFGSLVSNITATAETPEEKKYKSEAGQDLHMVAYYEVALERAAQAVNAIKEQVRNASNFGRKAEQIIREEGRIALGKAVKGYEAILASLKAEQGKVEGIYRLRMSNNKQAAARALEDGKRRAAQFEGEASTAEVQLGDFQTRRDAVLQRLGVAEKAKEKK